MDPLSVKNRARASARPANREQQPHQALLHELRVLGGRVRHPLAGPLALLGLEAERRRQRLQAQQQVVGGEAGGPQPGHDRAPHRRVPDPGQRLQQGRVARPVRSLFEMLENEPE